VVLSTVRESIVWGIVLLSAWYIISRGIFFTGFQVHPEKSTRSRTLLVDLFFTRKEVILMSQIEWKSVSIKELSTYAAVRLSLEIIPELIVRQNMAINRIRTSDPSKVSGVGGGNNDALLSAIVYRDELEMRLKEARKTVGAIDKALGAVTDEEYMLLDILFIHPRKKGVDLICEELCIERSAVYERRNKALEKFATAMYGCS